MNRRGQERRAAVVAAAAELLLVRGVDAVSHRAVAEAAGVPLAATTYYFAGLEELLVEALEHAARTWTAAAESALAQPGSPPARRLLEVAAGGAPDRERLLAVYQRYLEAARRPALREVVGRLDAQLSSLLARVAGAPALPARTLLAVCDGLLLAALAAGESDPVAAAEPPLADLLAALSPPGRPGAR